MHTTKLGRRFRLDQTHTVRFPDNASLPANSLLTSLEFRPSNISSKFPPQPLWPLSYFHYPTRTIPLPQPHRSPALYHGGCLTCLQLTLPGTFVCGLSHISLPEDIRYSLIRCLYTPSGIRLMLKFHIPLSVAILCLYEAFC